MYSDIETKRLIIRTWKMEDIHALARGLNDPYVAKWYGTAYPYTVENARSFIEDAIKNKKIKFAISLKETGEVIGGLGLHKKEDVHFASIWLSKEYHGKGIGTEAAKAWVDYCFTKHKIKELVNKVYKGNTASTRMQEKVGGYVKPAVDGGDEGDSVKIIITRENYQFIYKNEK